MKILAVIGIVVILFIIGVVIFYKHDRHKSEIQREMEEDNDGKHEGVWW